MIPICAVSFLALGWGWLRDRELEYFEAPWEVCEAEPGQLYSRGVYRASGGAAAPASRHPVSPSIYRERHPSRQLRVTYPPEGAVFPPNLCAPFITWDDGVNDLWQIVIDIPDAKLEWRHIARRRRWRVPRGVWRTLCLEAVEYDARIHVAGVRCEERRSSVQASRPLRFRMAADRADDYIVYRLVAPALHADSTPSTFVRHIGSMGVTPLLSSRGAYCFGCHAFSSPAGERGMISIQSQYMPRSQEVCVGLYRIAQKQGQKVELPLAIAMTTFTAWSPDGSKLAVAADQHKAPSLLLAGADQHASGLGVFDVRSTALYVLPGTGTPNRAAAYPCWSPDGRSLAFCSASLPQQPGSLKLNLQIVPFNRGRGGEPRDVPGASTNGRSNYLPRFSPDGKWLSFCQSDNGAFITSSSDIYLMSSDLQESPRRLACNAPYAGDSWHSWSSNSRWLAFASKRDDGIYARIYLTHIDADGHSSPAVRLPVDQPPLLSFSLPELVRSRPRVDDRDLFEVVRVERNGVKAKATRVP